MPYWHHRLHDMESRLAMDYESPIVVVVSVSVEHAFQRRDFLFLTNLPKMVDIGDIVVYNIRDRSIPIVHRVIESHISPTSALRELGKPIRYVQSLIHQKKIRADLPKGQKASIRDVRVNPLSQENPNTGQSQRLLTKGDNNDGDDIRLYAPGQHARPQGGCDWCGLWLNALYRHGDARYE